MRFLAYLLTLFLVGTAVAQNPTILQGNYITNVFGNSNFVLNPNAQTNTSNVTFTSTQVTRSTTTPLVATSEFNLSLLQNANADWSTRAFDAGMKGQNCEARFTYRGFATATTTAQIVQNSLVVAQLVLTPSTDPRIASINFPCGDLSFGTTFRIAQTTAAMTGTNEIGGIYVGLATNMANVAQAEFVGGGEWTTSTGFTRSSSAIQSTFAAFTSGAAGTAVGKATSAGSDTTITFPYLPAGQYYISVNFYNYLYLGGVTNANCEFTIQEIDSNTNSAISSSGAFSITTIYPPASTLQGNFNFSTGGQRRFRIVSRNTIANGASSLCVSLPDASVKAGIYVYRFPSSSELVVKPETQNVFGGVVYTTSNQQLFSGVAASATYSPYNNATWNQPTLLKGKAQVTTTNSGNDLGFSIPNMPVGSYKVSISGLIQAGVGTGTADKGSGCNFRIVETDSSGTLRTEIARQASEDKMATTTTNTRDFPTSFFGVYNNTSVATRNFRLEAAKFTDSTASNTSTCQVYSNTGTGASINSNIAFLLEPLDQPSNSALYVQGPVLGSQTGAAIPEGYVNEFATRSISDTSLRTQATPTANTWYYPWTGELTLPAGNWLLCYAVPVQLQQTSSGTVYGVSATRIENKTDNTELVQQIGSITAGGTITGHVTSHSACYPTAITTSKTFRVGIRYIDWASITTVSNIYLRCDQATCRLQAIRLN